MRRPPRANKTKTPSFKVGGMVTTRSILEGKWVKNLDVDPDVEKFEYEPKRFQYAFEGILRTYLADFIVARLSREKLVVEEVKRDAALSKPEERARYKAIEREVARQGYDFRIVLQSYIERPPRFQNVQRLWSLNPEKASVVILNRVKSRFQTDSNSCLANFIEPESGITFDDLLVLVRSGKIVVDLDEVLNTNSSVIDVRW